MSQGCAIRCFRISSFYYFASHIEKWKVLHLLLLAASETKFLLFWASPFEGMKRYMNRRVKWINWYDIGIIARWSEWFEGIKRLEFGNAIELMFTFDDTFFELRYHSFALKQSHFPNFSDVRFALVDIEIQIVGYLLGPAMTIWLEVLSTLVMLQYSCAQSPYCSKITEAPSRFCTGFIHRVKCSILKYAVEWSNVTIRLRMYYIYYAILVLRYFSFSPL